MVYIVILNWNGWRDTVACLRSLRSLNYHDYRIVVVDNASTNDSVVRIREEAPDVTIVETGCNLGFAGGNNVGIHLAMQHGAEYIWLLNNDTTVDSNALSAMVQVAESDATIGAVGSVLYYADDPQRIQAWGGGAVDFWVGRSRHALSPADAMTYISGASMLLRVAALRQVSVLDEQFFFYWEDTDFSYRLQQANWRLAVAADATVMHHESASVGKVSYRRAFLYYKGLVTFMRRYASVPVIPATAAILDRTARGILKARFAVVLGAWRGWLEGWRQ